jgi:translation initiation factor 6 (eIF-6)
MSSLTKVKLDRVTINLGPKNIKSTTIINSSITIKYNNKDKSSQEYKI